MKTNKKTSVELLKKDLFLSVERSLPSEKFGLLLSGGLDSTVIGKVLRLQGKEFDCFFVGIKDFAEPKDFSAAKKAAQELGCRLNVKLVSVAELESALPKVISLIGSCDPVMVGVNSLLYFASKEASASSIKYLFCGSGADELFAGYNRFSSSKNINADCKRALAKLHKQDLPFAKKVCAENEVELRSPYLDAAFAKKALALPVSQKIGLLNGERVNKKILREVALELGLSKEIALRPKRAAQYGSNFDKALEFLARKNNFKSKREYLASFVLKKEKFPIAALISTGKDSLYAMHVLQKQGHEVKCLITIDSQNKDSFMFHTPTIALAKLQSEALAVPLFVARTKGEKEKELVDLKKAIAEAKKKFGIKGVSTGALYSMYQSERIEKICRSLKLKCLSPLWHKNQAEYLRELLREKFEVIITKIACYGLDEKWLGRRIDSRAIEELVALEKKFGINVAGEGGEYESLVLDAPLFKKKIVIEFGKKMENEFTGAIVVKRANLVEK